MTPYELHRLAPFLEEYTAGVERARASYDLQPIASGRPGPALSKCEWADCTDTPHAKGLCHLHYRRTRRRQGKGAAA